LNRAARHMGELDRLLSGYAKRLTIGFEAIPGRPGFARAIFSELPPEEMPLIVGDIVHNIRSALDLLICDIARFLGSSTEHLSFPFAENAANLEKIIRKDPIKSLGAELQNALRKHKPYRNGGNDLLYGLHMLDISDKHRLIVPVVGAAVASFDRGRFMHDSIRATNPDEADDYEFLYATGPLAAAPDPSSKATKRVIFSGGDILDESILSHGDEIAIGSDGTPYVRHLPGKLSVFFPSGGPAFVGGQLMPTLRRIGAMTAGIIQELAETEWT